MAETGDFLMSYLTGLDYLAVKLWPWLLLAFFLGICWGWFSCPGPRAWDEER
ncbi:MAG: hypothetical protein R3D33_03330 [Hyphomicrobiaceae bacterium]